MSRDVSCTSTQRTLYKYMNKIDQLINFSESSMSLFLRSYPPPPAKVIPERAIANKIQKLDPLEAVKTFKGRWFRSYGAISGYESSAVTFINRRR